jgi:uncharacterized membrane protein YraQ (UPF0718 family)
MSASIMFFLASIFGACSISHPEFLDDSKQFFKDLLSKDMLPILGIILTISLASVAQLHLEFNKIEERRGRLFLGQTRKALRGAAYMLIGTFVAGIVVVSLKSILAGDNSVSQALFNSIGVLLLILNVIILCDLTSAAFSIGPEIHRRDDCEDSSRSDGDE